MFNQLIKNRIVPTEWKKMKILPIDKGSGWLEMKEKRGLFITNILSKCIEKILFTRREKIHIENLSNFQCGGVKSRSIQDNLFIMNHYINKYKKKKKDIYILFADIEKCFDNLWLRDCIIELIGCGTPIQEAAYIYQMNKDVQARVQYVHQ